MKLPNGHLLIMLGQSGFGVTRDKRVFWEFADHAHFQTVNQIQLLDLPREASPLRWNMLHEPLA